MNVLSLHASEHVPWGPEEHDDSRGYGESREYREHSSVWCLPHKRQERNLHDPRVSVVIPARNEAKNLPAVIARLPEGLHEVILVDGASVDTTVEVARRLIPDVIVVEQTGNGKGNALAIGLHAATGDILVTVDADGSTDPAEIPRFVSALVAGADFVKGSRFASGGGSADITLARRLGNRVLTGMVNRVYGTHYTDLCYGFTAFWADCLPVLQSVSPLLNVEPGHDDSPFGSGFEVETVINVRAAKAALRVWEVPSYELRRMYGASNLSALRDGLRVARRIWSESPAFSARYHKTMSAPVEAVGGQLPNPVRALPAQRVRSHVPGVPVEHAEQLAAALPAMTGNGHTNGNGHGNGHGNGSR